VLRWFTALLCSAVLLTTLAGAQTDVTLLVAGDVTLGGHYQEYVDEEIRKGHPADEAVNRGFEKVRKVTREADIFLVNLECPFTERGEMLSKNFNFRARPSLVAALTSAGVDVVSLANNHVMDYGSDGLDDTVSALDGEGIRHFGAGPSLTEAREPVILEVKGVRVAFLGYLFLGETHLEPYEIFATDDQPGAAGHYDDAEALQSMIEADIQSAKTQADHVILFFHWGREGHADPETYQVALAHAAIDAGASAVLGSHPHNLQGVEVYKGSPIAYSLGNFVFGGNWNPADKRTALLELKLNKSDVTSTAVIPAYADRFPKEPFQPYLVHGSGAAILRTYLTRLSAAFPDTLGSLRLASH
jgi:poly-gamma-glutamate capsule biosynthesis protein CapA/YwtB (metallophosphatase superfamily)